MTDPSGDPADRMVPSTPSPARLEGDVLIIGGGPAGSAAAIVLALSLIHI